MNNTENEIADAIENVLNETRNEIAAGVIESSSEDIMTCFVETSSFVNEGILTDDEGFVIFMANGQRYQVTVKEW